MTGAVIVAAGRGHRLGAGAPKAMRELAGRPLYAYSLEAALNCELVGSIALVAPSHYVEVVTKAVARQASGRPVRVVEGGLTRQQSVQRGILALPDTCLWVAVHDAARPLVTARLFTDVIRLAQKSGGALAAHAATDTIKHEIENGTLVTLPRRQVWHAETPQVFRRPQLERALDQCERESLEVTDEAEAMEHAGAVMSLYTHAEPNPKISTEADWAWVETLILRR